MPGGDVRVVSAEAVRGALEAVAPQFTRDTGIAVSFAFMTAGQVRERVEAHDAADLAIASNTVIAALVKSGVASRPVDLGRIGLAVAMRAGAAAPDLATPEAFVAALRAARSISFTDPAAGGTAGIYVAGLLQRLGIADEVLRKAVFSSGGRDAAAKAASGEAELAITFPSEIVPVAGASVAGPLPEELQSYTIYAAAIPAAAAASDAAARYLAALTAPAARMHWRSAGFEPLN